MKEIRLFNDYGNKARPIPRKSETQEVEKQIIFYADNSSRFDELLENYEMIARRRVDMVYHHLYPLEKTILNSYEAKKYIEQQTIRGMEANFDLPMFVTMTGIPIIGIRPLEEEHIKDEEVFSKLLIVNAIHMVSKTLFREVAVIVHDVILREHAPLIREALPNALFRFSKYEG